MNTRRSSPALLLVALILGACRSAPTKIYTLYSLAPAATPGDHAGPPVRVDAVHVPPTLNRLELVSVAAPGELKLNDLAHWSAPLPSMMRQTLTENLLTRLPPDRVIFPQLARPPGALSLTVDLLDVEVGPAGATLRASWTLTGDDRSVPAHRGIALLQSATPAADAPSIARALSTLLGRLADEIVTTL